jgi:hypothetical protein
MGDVDVELVERVTADPLEVFPDLEKFPLANFMGWKD